MHGQNQQHHSQLSPLRSLQGKADPRPSPLPVVENGCHRRGIIVGYPAHG